MAGKQTLARCALAALVSLAAARASPATAADTPYTFAVLGPLSGDNAIYGTTLQRGVRLAADQINASGGIKGKPVKLQFLDTQCQATQAANAASKIASDPAVFAVIGDVCSSATMAAIPILYRAGIAEISGDSTSPKITDLVKSRHYSNFSRTIPTDAAQAHGMLKLAAALHKTRVAILYSSDDFGQAIYALQKSLLAKGLDGMKLVDAETYTPSINKDFTPQLTKIATAKPDVIMLDGYYNDAGTAVSQMGRVGLSGITLVASAGIDQSGFMQLGGAPTEGTYVFSNYNPDNTSPDNTKFVGAYRAKYHADPNEQAVFGYEIPFILKQAIDAGATKKTLAKVVRAQTFTGPTGITKFDANGDVVGKSGVVDIVKGGKLVFDPKMTKVVNE